jgi:hypothetical protein
MLLQNSLPKRLSMKYRNPSYMPMVSEQNTLILRQSEYLQIEIILNTDTVNKL